MRVLSNWKRFIVSLLAFSFVSITVAQESYLGTRLNTVTTAVPFLMIAPDARAGAMGDVGVSSSPDINSLHWNPAKYAFIENDMGFSLAYSPWLRALVNDINLAYLSGYKRIDDNSAVAGSLLFFSLGDITFMGENAEVLGNYRPSEFALSGTYSRKFSDYISGAVSARFIHSNLTQGQFVQGQATKPGTSIAADVAVFYTKEIELMNTDAIFSWGINISNIGAKISYSDDNTARDFIPTNLRLGPSLTFDLDDYNRLTMLLDFNKLLVPTPPVYLLDEFGQPVVGDDGRQKIDKGMDPEVSVPVGMLQSFYDAPDGFSEELREVNIGFGLEYWYDKQFAIRAGYFHEHATKGNRKYVTLGVGLRYNVFGLDFAYMIPTAQRHPLENTLRFTLSFDFDAFRAQEQVTP
ncbi:MAG TPA: type IX secretion system outer membrane channel protein PorV [Bacteroidales bacterium]|nr:type IX secretion system outer membrane channel protein PorV [Bacteroidales bacterium]